MVRPLLILAALGGCPSASSTSEAPKPAATPAGAAPAPTGSAAPGDTTGVLAGVCEASSVVPWQGGWLVADNEDGNALHAYGPDLAPKGPVALPVEIDDIEAIALVDGGWWVVGSHSTNKDGEARPARERILGPDGRVRTLALDACPRCVAAKGRAPDAGGFNIEGAAWQGGTLWLGLRGPLAESGAALLLAADETGRVEQVVEVPLGGQGIRDLAIDDDGGLLVVAGGVADGASSHSLWRLAGPGSAPQRLADLPASTEGIARDPADPTRLLYVTDGDGKPGKRCKTPATWGVIALSG